MGGVGTVGRLARKFRGANGPLIKNKTLKTRTGVKENAVEEKHEERRGEDEKRIDDFEPSYFFLLVQLK